MSTTVKTIEELGKRSQKIVSKIVTLRDVWSQSDDKFRGRMYLHIADLVIAMHSEGKNLTQKAIGELSGLTQGYISKVLGSMEKFAKAPEEVGGLGLTRYDEEARGKARSALADAESIAKFIETWSGYSQTPNKDKEEVATEIAEDRAEAASAAGDEVSTVDMDRVTEYLTEKMKDIVKRIQKNALHFSEDQAQKLVEAATRMVANCQKLPALKKPEQAQTAQKSEEKKDTTLHVPNQVAEQDKQAA